MIEMGAETDITVGGSFEDRLDLLMLAVESRSEDMCRYIAEKVRIPTNGNAKDVFLEPCEGQLFWTIVMQYHGC